MRGRRVVPVVVATGVAMLALAGPAAAEVDGPCDGFVTIDQQEPWQARSSEVLVIPEGATEARWEGLTTTVITDHSGRVGVAVGPITIPVADWEGENADEETEADGVYAFGDLRQDLPFEVTGYYRVVGEHSGTGGSCTGSAVVLVEGGNPLGNPVGQGGAAAAVLGAGGLLAAGLGGRGGV